MAALGQMGTSGSSGSSAKTKTVALNAFEAFLSKSSGKYQGTFASMGAEILCEQTIWLEFVYYLVNDPRTKKGSTVIEYLRKVFSLARDRLVLIQEQHSQQQ
jgi:hypothetical protein